MSDQDRISPYIINTMSSRLVIRLRKYHLRGYKSIQILQTNIKRIVLKTVRRITNEIQEVKGLNSRTGIGVYIWEEAGDGLYFNSTVPCHPGVSMVTTQLSGQ